MDERPMAKPDLYVVTRFLEKLAVKGGSVRKTQLQMAVGLNYNVYSRYLRWLEDRKMVSLVSDSESTQAVLLTEKGWRIYNQLLGMMEELVRQR